MKDTQIIIGITGKARSGKDTIAGILCRRFGFTRIGLADGVRSAFRDLDGPTWELTKEIEAAGKTTRWALQQLGTEARCKVAAPALWARLLATKMAYLREIHPVYRSRFVVPDIRFGMESDWFRNLYGDSFQLWKVARPDAGLAGEAGLHASETEVDSLFPDCYFPNDGTIEQLGNMVADMAGKLLEVL